MHCKWRTTWKFELIYYLKPIVQIPTNGYALSDFMINYWYILVTAVIQLLIAYIAIKRNPKGRYMLDLVKLKIPVFGALAQKQIIARISRTMASLFASSVPVLQILRMSGEVSGNKVYEKVLDESRESLRRGASCHCRLLKAGYFLV